MEQRSEGVRSEKRKGKWKKFLEEVDSEWRQTVVEEGYI